MSAPFANQSQQHNETYDYVNTSLEQFASYYAMVCGVVAMIFNVIIVLAFIRTRTLRSSFMVYVIQLTLSEIILISTVLPGNVVREYYGYWPGSERLCFAFSYFNNVVGSGIRYGHVLITLNRFWAVYFPLGYRSYHSSKVACLIVTLMWCFVHAIQLPVVIPGLMFRKPDDLHCTLNTSFMPVQAIIYSTIGFDLPQLIIVLFYPLVMCKLCSRRRGRKAKKNRVGTSFQLSVQPGPSAPAPSGEEGDDSRPTTNRRCWTMSSNYRALTALTVAVIICWTPDNIYYLLVHSITGYWNTTYFAVQNAFGYSITWLNPILFYLSMKKLQLAVNHIFSR